MQCPALTETHSTGRPTDRPTGMRRSKREATRPIQERTNEGNIDERSKVVRPTDRPSDRPTQAGSQTGGRTRTSVSQLLCSMQSERTIRLFHPVPTWAPAGCRLDPQSERNTHFPAAPPALWTRQRTPPSMVRTRM